MRIGLIGRGHLALRGLSMILQYDEEMEAAHLTLTFLEKRSVLHAVIAEQHSLESGTQQEITSRISPSIPFIVLTTEALPAPCHWSPEGGRNMHHISDQTPARGICQAIRGIVHGTGLYDQQGFTVSEKNISDREWEVLVRIARGLTQQQIARRLGISPHTVDTYVRRIRAKLNVRSRAELVRAALELAATRESRSP